MPQQVASAQFELRPPDGARRASAAAATARAHRRARDGAARRRGRSARRWRPGCGARGPDRDSATGAPCTASCALEFQSGTRELGLEEAVVEARVVRDENGTVEQRSKTCCASPANGGASRTISLVMPVSHWISGGIGTPGLTSDDHSSTRVSSPSTVDAHHADFSDAFAFRDSSRSFRRRRRRGAGRTRETSDVECKQADHRQRVAASARDTHGFEALPPRR